MPTEVDVCFLQMAEVDSSAGSNTNGFLIDWGYGSLRSRIVEFLVITFVSKC